MSHLKNSELMVYIRSARSFYVSLSFELDEYAYEMAIKLHQRYNGP